MALGILASMSIPAVFPPVEIGGKYFIDGGMKNAVPANVARQMGADIVIGVNINRELEKIDYNSILNNVQLALYLMIDGYTKLNEPFADLMIVPDVKYDSYMAYSRVDYFIQRGYEAARLLRLPNPRTRIRNPGRSRGRYRPGRGDHGAFHGVLPLSVGLRAAGVITPDHYAGVQFRKGDQGRALSQAISRQRRNTARAPASQPGRQA